MKEFVAITFLIANTFLCKGQSLNLVPVDSANFEIVADTLIDRYAMFPDSIKFNPENYKSCPCTVAGVIGLISYKSSSFIIRKNKCIFLYEKDSVYFVRVGQLEIVNAESKKYQWKLSTRRLQKNKAERYIAFARSEIEKAQIPRFKDFLVVHDGISHTFGDLERNKYATTPVAGWSASVEQLIKMSNFTLR